MSLPLSQIFFATLLAFICGAAVMLISSWFVLGWWVLFWLGIFTAVWWWGRWMSAVIIGVVLVGFALGGLRSYQTLLTQEQHPLRAFAGETVTFVASVETAPVPQRNSVRFRASVNEIVGIGRPSQDASVNVVTNPRPLVRAGDELRLDCRLVRDTFGARQGKLTCLFPKLEILVSASPTATVRGLLESMRLSFLDSISRVFPEPAAGFIAGLLVGGSAGLTESDHEALIATGTIHLVALSGFNISIIAGFFTYLLRRLGVALRWHLPVITVFLILFVVMVGAHASIVRAAIMGGLVVLARTVGRRSTGRNALALAAALMVLHNPLVLWDIGFQLSVAATAGILTLYPILEQRTNAWGEFLQMKEALLLSVSAQLFVLPLLLYHFERLSVVAPLVNMLVVPPIAYLMLFGFLGALAGFVWVPLGQLVGLGASVGATVVLWIIIEVGSWPFTNFSVRFGLLLVIISYTLLWFVVRNARLGVRPQDEASVW